MIKLSGFCVEGYSVFGHVVIKENEKIAQMIIDGQQRITTLVGIFLRPEEGEYDKKWYVYFNLKEKRFEIPERKQRPRNIGYLYGKYRTPFDS
ncbi:hypothetical protein QUF76_13665 [Desulfobacterales bacterium HSG16]|nr:hypothetical protein [Desulfobacterales bacterium HSG16]